MKRFLYTVLLSGFFFTFTYSNNNIDYLEPLPDANYVSVENNIIIGFEKPIYLSQTELLNSLSVNGTISGAHEGNIILCDGQKKIIFTPFIPFSNGEKINVIMTGRLLQLIHPGLKEYLYSFNTSLRKINYVPLNDPEDGIYLTPSVFDDTRHRDLLPALTVTTNNNPAQGFLFTVPYYRGFYIPTISDVNGAPYWYTFYVQGSGDLKKQPNGNITFYDKSRDKHLELNTNYDLVDSFYCGNGYHADIHELRVLNNNHALLMAYDPEEVDMSQIVQGGNPHAIVTGLIIQEIDENKNVVFQWRSWDHFAITDAQHVNLLDSVIDYVHGNAIESDNDGNIIVSSRHLNEITKINRTTGDIIWRFGGAHNQFTFLNDTLRFTYQHAVRRIANGNLTLFDNGNYHTPPFSRAVEYSLNETGMTATLVWQYRKTPDVFGFWGGYVQRLDNGNTLIGWGGTSPCYYRS